MPILVWVFALFMLVAAHEGFKNDNNVFEKQKSFDEAKSSSLSGQMIAYASYVRVYLEAHPATTGTVTDGAMNIPSWFQNRDPRIGAYFSSGRAYVYCTTTCPRNLEAELSEITDKSINVGVVSNGKLSRFGVVDSSYTLPTSLKNEDIVYVLNY
ncbi:type IV pilus biogenesis protein PilM [Citrobacter freundii]|uniref:type IV pilus biogenesis protein PilM n=1 Tax=Citrobacter freundii TaxID=546 RepID=UPI0019067438|nr:type IV pilus biogenesis protein PilM [Citrobacter freundii]MBJ8931621.1 type IV pilus biogenesis protein PilM [Citrobacter freundii]